MATDRTTIRTAYAALADALAAVNSLDYTGLPIEVLLELQSQRETLKCSAEAVDHQILAAAQTQATAKEIGAKDWPEVLHVRLRISREEARRRVRDTDNLGPRSAITGEPLGPVWELVAAALAEGAINSEHVQVITWFFQKLPLWAADPITLAQCETDLVADARVKTPEDLRKVAADLLYRLDQDGPEPDDTEPDPKRSFVMGKQRPDGRTDVTAQLDPEGRAYWQALFDKYAAPGMCNPADEVPCLSGTPTQEQIDADTRTLAQRQYDAFKMVGRMMLASSSGVHNGFPVGVVATCTVTDLEKRAGMAATHTGTKLPVKDLVRMAAQGSDNYLAVFDDHTGQPLYLGRAARTASTAQRLALFARDLGCTRPNCTAPASRSQAHHVNTNWRDDGPTDITNLTLACGPDNRLADTGGWTTTMGPDGRTHWTPPPLLDVGQPRTNHYHHPTLYRTERGGDADSDSDGESDSPTG
ncbi:HNH endonuclease signature motif containing protein [Mycolicibacterium phocaicum]|uniref:HNH endonuclease n=1 Tax=Mycolicibacterium phocaicum TaxID=319706 RepID=A0A7I7ZIQ8_9MYCO|nr:HNH endonuclease signature motif containing protein [Mycolicibacterium phocaicum]TLH68713.1 HNH endonuclease [Mycolicibacterium phocaicum]BBZ53970.1 HNH endonuclease [Mycolicibacterium phocaicum]